MMGALLFALCLGATAGEPSVVVVATFAPEFFPVREEVQEKIEARLKEEVTIHPSGKFEELWSREGFGPEHRADLTKVSLIALRSGVTHVALITLFQKSVEVGGRGYRRRTDRLSVKLVRARGGVVVYSQDYELIERRITTDVGALIRADLMAGLSPAEAPDARGAESPPTLPNQGEEPADPAVVVVDDSDDDTVIVVDDSDDDTMIVVDDSDDDTMIVVDDSDDSDFGGGSPSGMAFGAQPRTYLLGEVSTQGVLDLAFENTGEDVIEWWNFGRMKLDHKASADLRAVAEMWVRWGVVAEDTSEGETFYGANARNGKWASDLQLRQGYLSWKVGDLTLKVGQRIFVWGQNEYQPAADVLNPVDLRYGLLAGFGSTRDGKVPVLALDGTYWMGNTGVQAVLVPFFNKSRTVFYGRDFALAAPGTAQEQLLGVLGNVHPSIQDRVQDSFWGTEVPADSLEGASGALRLVSNLAGWDLALTGYYGWDLTPNIALDSDLRDLLGQLGAGGGDLESALLDPVQRNKLLSVQQKAAVGHELVKVNYQRMMRFAFEVQGVVGPFVVRLDAGYSPGLLYYTEGLDSVSLPTAMAVGGIEYTYGEEFYLAMTGFGTAMHNPPSEATLLGLEKTLDPGVSPGERDFVFNYGGMMALRYSFTEQDLEFTLSGLYNVEPGSYLGTAQVSYTYFDPHDFRVGVLVLGGPQGTLFGNFEGNDFAYVQYGASW